MGILVFSSYADRKTLEYRVFRIPLFWGYSVKYPYFTPIFLYTPHP